MDILQIARGELGVSEVAGKVARPRILEYFEAAGHPEVKSDETAWCSAFANYCVVTSGMAGTMSLAARSWLQWGRECKPKPGAIGVWPRGRSQWQGHVAIVEKVTGDTVECIGGNQGNKVSRKSFLIADALGFREPVTLKNSRTAKAAVAGSVSTGASMLLEQAQQAKDMAADLQQYITWASYAVVALTIFCFALMVYYRMQDAKEKGR